MSRPDRPTLSDGDRLSARVDLSLLEPLLTELRQTDHSAPIIPRVDPSSLDAPLPASPPRHGTTVAETLDELRGVIVEGRRKNAHPGFYGYVCSPGLPTDPLAHALTAALNQNVTAYTSAAGPAVVERRVVQWLCDMLGYPPEAAGLFTSGGSLANFQAMATAVHHALDGEAMHTGLVGLDRRPVVLATHEAHFSIARAAVLLGLGRDAVRLVETDTARRMDPEALAASLKVAIARKEQPVCVVASAGTASTGAIDPLHAIAEICEAHGIWLHVDGAYGGAAILDPALRQRLGPLERANSVSMDLHKWFFLGFDASVALYRDPEPARRLYFTRADYVQLPAVMPTEMTTFFDFGPETSRRFRALPAYLAFRHYGLDRLGRNVAHQVACVEYLARQVDAAADLELIAAPELSICCFRYAPQDAPAQAVDAWNAAIRGRLEAEGDFYLSRTVLDGRDVLRVCVLSHATNADHMDALLDRVRAIGSALAREP